MPRFNDFRYGRKAVNAQELTGATRGALYVEERGKHDNGQNWWWTRCLCCQNRSQKPTCKVNDGRCGHCGATMAPSEQGAA